MACFTYKLPMGVHLLPDYWVNLRFALVVAHHCVRLWIMFFQLRKVSYALLLYKHVIFFLNPLGGWQIHDLRNYTIFFVVAVPHSPQHYFYTHCTSEVLNIFVLFLSYHSSQITKTLRDWHFELENAYITDVGGYFIKLRIVFVSIYHTNSTFWTLIG